MISKYLKSKNVLDQIKFPFDIETLSKSEYNFWYLNSHPGNDFYYLDDVFTDHEMKLINEIAKKLPNESSKIGGNGKGSESFDYRRSTTTWININEITSWIYKKLTEIINQVNSDYFNFDLEVLSTLQFTEYFSNENDMYKCHVDTFKTIIPKNRKLTMVLQLSDPTEYEGGDLLLYFSKDPVEIKKKKGTMVFFPSYVLHEVTPVTKGCRKTLVGWVEGPQFR